MVWILFAVAVAAGFFSPSLGIVSGPASAAVYVLLRIARKGGRIEAVRVLLLLFTPLIGLLGGAVLFLLGPGF